MLPDAAGELDTLQRAGNVLQVVHVDYNTIQTFTVPANVEQSQATGLVASITPKSATSKILVLCSANLGHAGASTVVRALVQRTGPATANATLSTNSATSNWTAATFIPTPNWMAQNSAIHWLDSPNTTAACTYTLRIGGNVAAQIVYLNTQAGYANQWGGVSYMTLLEIAA